MAEQWLRPRSIEELSIRLQGQALPQGEDRAQFIRNLLEATLRYQRKNHEFLAAHSKSFAVQFLTRFLEDLRPHYRAEEEWARVLELMLLFLFDLITQQIKTGLRKQKRRGLE